MSEQIIQKTLFRYLKRKHKKAKEKIFVLNRCVDIVYINENKELITIEIKLHDWRKAIRQAIDHQMYADRAYICMPQYTKVGKPLIDELSKYGVGLLLVDVSGKRIRLEEKVEAERARYCWEQARNKVENLIYA